MQPAPAPNRFASPPNTKYTNHLLEKHFYEKLYFKGNMLEKTCFIPPRHWLSICRNIFMLGHFPNRKFCPRPLEVVQVMTSVYHVKT